MGKKSRIIMAVIVMVSMVFSADLALAKVSVDIDNGNSNSSVSTNTNTNIITQTQRGGRRSSQSANVTSSASSQTTQSASSDINVNIKEARNAANRFENSELRRLPATGSSMFVLFGLALLAGVATFFGVKRFSASVK